MAVAFAETATPRVRRRRSALLGLFVNDDDLLRQTVYRRPLGHRQRPPVGTARGHRLGAHL